MEDRNSSSFSRKRFLGAVGGTAGAVAGLLYPGVAHATGLTAADVPGPLRDVDAPDPGFALGEVVSKTADGVVLQTPTTARAVLIPPGPTVWKEIDVTIDAVNVGDFVHARGTPQIDGSLAAEPGWIWVNIGRSDGVIDAVDGTGVTIRGPRNSHRIDFSSRVEIIYSTDGSPVACGVSALRSGMVIGSVGLRLPDGRLRATRIWIDNSKRT